MALLDRISTDPKILGGKPAIRNMRFSVAQLLELLAGGMSVKEILDDYPYLELEDIQACLSYAALIANAGIFPISFPQNGFPD